MFSIPQCINMYIAEYATGKVRKCKTIHCQSQVFILSEDSEKPEKGEDCNKIYCMYGVMQICQECFSKNAMSFSDKIGGRAPLNPTCIWKSLPLDYNLAIQRRK